MPQKIYLVDAFAHAPFTGNPAGVCPLEREPDEKWMQSVATEMNQAETAFFWPLEGGDFGLRWFTPALEVDLCGHATLASAHVLLAPLPSGGEGVGGEGLVRFHTKSGVLTCRQVEGAAPSAPTIAMDFPSEPPLEANDPGGKAALGVQPVWCGANRMDWFFLLESADQLLSLKPDFRAVAVLGKRGVIVTARPNDRTSEPIRTSPNLRASDPPSPSPDFLSRFFAPQSGIDEDPVTGSAHCALGPFWAQRLGKPSVVGYQASRRGGFVGIEDRGDRVLLSGRARTAVVGELRE